MAATTIDGAFLVYGGMGNLQNPAGTVILPDPDSDAMPSGFYQGTALLDSRFFFPKDKVQGFAGVVPALASTPDLITVNQIPATHATNNIAVAATVTNGTAMTLAGATTTTATGAVVINIPIVPFNGYQNGSAPVTAPLVLDFGFAFGACTAGSATIQVADSSQFGIGMPLVVAGVGNSGGTAPLLTQVATIVDATHITVIASAVPQATLNPAAVATGNMWGPSEVGFPLSTAYAPYLGKGPGLFLDPRQTVARGIAVTCNNASGVGGAITVAGWDIYGEPMTEAITITPASALTAYGKKAFKAIESVTPGFTDGTYTYAIGTSDEFGFPIRSNYFETELMFWNSALLTANTGWTVADGTNPATTTTGDVRGTLLTSSIGNGSGASANASNGTVSALAMTGRRLTLRQALMPSDQIAAVATNSATLFGQLQV